MEMITKKVTRIRGLVTMLSGVTVTGTSDNLLYTLQFLHRYTVISIYLIDKSYVVPILLSVWLVLVYEQTATGQRQT